MNNIDIESHSNNGSVIIKWNETNNPVQNSLITSQQQQLSPHQNCNTVRWDEKESNSVTMIVNHANLIASNNKNLTNEETHQSVEKQDHMEGEKTSDIDKERLEEMKKRFPELFPEEITDEDTEDVCPICLEAFVSENPAIICACTHNFHFQCVEEWLQRSPSCPVCFSKLKYDLMSSETEVAYARQQLGYHSPAEQVTTYQQRIGSSAQYDLHALLRAHRSANGTHMIHNHRSAIRTPENNAEVRPRSRSFFGKIFDKLFASVPSLATSPVGTNTVTVTSNPNNSNRQNSNANNDRGSSLSLF
jgi:hypothetical protein